MTAESENIIIRPWTEQNAECLYGLLKEIKSLSAAQWEMPSGAEDCRRIIKILTDCGGFYAVIPKPAGRPAGIITVMSAGNSTLALNHAEAEIGYAVADKFCGRGYASGALLLISERLLKNRAFKKLYCVCEAENEASRHVLEKCGFALSAEADRRIKSKNMLIYSRAF